VSEGGAQESARAKRARIKAEREAAIAEAIAAGAIPEDAARTADAAMRDRSKAEAVARARAAKAAAEAQAAGEDRAAEGESVPDASAADAPVDPTPTTAPLLIVDALSEAPALGIHRGSLNFAMFPSTFERGERLGAGPVLKTWRRLHIIGNTWFQLESLSKFSATFQPVWYPRFLIYPRVGHFVRVSIAAGQAETFIVFPRLTLPFGRRR
jgi:hypothetical protein